MLSTFVESLRSRWVRFLWVPVSLAQTRTHGFSKDIFATQQAHVSQTLHDIK
jgi:hypothetical protein